MINLQRCALFLHIFHIFSIIFIYCSYLFILSHTVLFFLFEKIYVYIFCVYNINNFISNMLEQSYIH